MNFSNVNQLIADYQQIDNPESKVAFLLDFQEALCNMPDEERTSFREQIYFLVLEDLAKASQIMSRVQALQELNASNL